MEDLKIDIREVIIRLGDKLDEVKRYRNNFLEYTEGDAIYDKEVEIELARYEAEMDMIKHLRIEYLKLYELDLDDIDRYIKNKVEADRVIEMRNINPVNTTGEIESITYTIK